MPYAGEIAVPPYQVTSKDTVSSSYTTTTEIVTDTVTGAVLSGETYEVIWDAPITSLAAGDEVFVNIREDSVSGTHIVSSTVYVNTATRVFQVHLYGQYVASSNTSKSFVATIYRASGTGNVIRYGSSIAPSYLRLIRIS